jgi:putative aldouronate transport system permease protein
MHRKLTPPERVWLWINYCFFLLLVIGMLAPMLIVVTKSVSSERAILSGQIGILPDFATMHFDSYGYVLRNHNFMRAFFLTVAVTLLGTACAVVVTSLAGYAVSKPYLAGRKAVLVFSIFTMIFSGGLIPTYWVMSALRLVNTFHILWLAGIFTTSHMLILKNSFEAVPQELEEAAVIDGSGQLGILFRVYLPVSKASIAVIALFHAVEYWNNYYTSMIYTSRDSLKSLQLALKGIIYSASDVFLELYGVHSLGEITAQSTIAACIVVATVPILVAYPFLQKHFTKGVLIGSVKG